MKDLFSRWVETLAIPVTGVLFRVDKLYRDNIQEVRLRINRPLSLIIGGEIYFVSQSGAVSFKVPENPFIIDETLIEQSYLSLAGYSVHSHQEELAKGFLTTKNGDRAGICGTAVIDNMGNVVYKNISSINLRVSREIIGLSKDIVPRLDVLAGVLVVGMPSSGKTTLLRDMVRFVSSTQWHSPQKIALLDERMELSAMNGCIPSYDVGLCTDVICGQSKAVAIEQAIRTLSPNIIACDEVGAEEEVFEIEKGLCCGVAFFATVHCGDLDDLYKSRKIGRLMDTGGFNSVVFLENIKSSMKYKIISKDEYDAVKESFYEVDRTGTGC